MLKNNSVYLTIKPKLCVLNNVRQTCVDTVVLEWQSDKELDTCVYRSDEKKALQCWQQATSGMWEESVRTRESIRFELKSGEQVLISESIKVLHSYTRPVQRRRARHPWSIF